MFEQSGNGTLFLGGQKISGADIRDQNGEWQRTSGITLLAAHFSGSFDIQLTFHRYRHLVLATQAIANVVKSSFGPSGLDKMMVDDIGVGASEETPPRTERIKINVRRLIVGREI